jgi:hypothetical protein
MRFHLEILLFPTIFLQVYSFECSNGGQSIPNENVCLIPVTKPKFYYDVIRECALLGGIPVKIQNVYENAFVFSITADFNGVSPYIGVERKPDNTWTYSDGSPLTYQNWANNEPKISNSSICVIMNVESGKWQSAECYYTRPSICSVQGGKDSSTTRTPPTTGRPDAQCPDDWVYNARTDFCYYLQNFTYPDAVHWQLYNWTTAEANCQRMNSHLVSIHSKEEDDFVYDLVTSNVSNITNVAPVNSACYYQFAWIGYSGNGTIGTGTWTDGSPVDYIGGSPFPTVYYWQIGNDASCNLHEWHAEFIYDTFARFVCKMPSKSRSKRALFELNHNI